jgi:hypothetical protein
VSRTPIRVQHREPAVAELTPFAAAHGLERLAFVHTDDYERRCMVLAVKYLRMHYPGAVRSLLASVSTEQLQAEVQRRLAGQGGA